MAGAAILLLLPGRARADHDGFSYGHAEITLGFPQGHVTLGRTWDDDPRQVIVEDREVDDEPDRVIVEERRCPPPEEHVTVIERYPEPVRVVRKVYVDRPSCERPEAVYYDHRPERVIYAPSRTVIIAPGEGGRFHGDDDFRDHGDRGNRGYHGHQGNHDYRGDPGNHGGDYGGNGNHGGHGGNGGDTQGYQSRSNGPPDLFPEDHGRPARARGVQHFAQR